MGLESHPEIILSRDISIQVDSFVLLGSCREDLEEVKGFPSVLLLPHLNGELGHLRGRERDDVGQTLRENELRTVLRPLSDIDEVEALHQGEVVGSYHEDQHSVFQDVPLGVDAGKDIVLLNLLAFELGSIRLQQEVVDDGQVSVHLADLPSRINSPAASDPKSLCIHQVNLALADVAEVCGCSSYSLSDILSCSEKPSHWSRYHSQHSLSKPLRPAFEAFFFRSFFGFLEETAEVADDLLSKALGSHGNSLSDVIGLLLLLPKIGGASALLDGIIKRSLDIAEAFETTPEDSFDDPLDSLAHALGEPLRALLHSFHRVSHQLIKATADLIDESSWVAKQV
mmetsp:Transcript_3165/g.4819  ORF Transcript_3165/g.4819 Transcript_3165/m.4819 type:complete len:341 (+) Transcript_3165:434-1456(+)|eukprot:CAMPEP_0170479482 /NCGR_PEP_ID=MMETSP0208-20121228/703_1 /TAXON_ID=197538 /ORGANISM="Strombidium inclinatum, Strain S3" /LENGTH=340 /DNA_ID=CAMNT_0010751885 /DNA_START=434 /DNA_END=1456 /DNA_ORIENTATION=+